MALRAADVPFQAHATTGPTVKDRVFRERGEQRYSLELLPAGITFEIDRLRRESQQLVGELAVTVNGSFPHARTVDGLLSMGDLNLSSVQARGTRAKLLADRSGVDGLDWHGFVEEFCIKVIAAERLGRPAVALAEVQETKEDEEIWTLSGFPILQNLPMVLFGDSSSGKSYFAMWIAGTLAQQGVGVLYADWEFAGGEHRRRFDRLFQPMPKNVQYAWCDKPLKDEADRLLRLIREHNCRYLICDSIGFAIDGPAEAQEGASAYFRALRRLSVGSLNIAHIPKQYEEGKDPQIFGSVFFRHGARSVWFIQRTQQNPPGEISFGLYHRKNNVGELLKPKGYKLVFRGNRTLLESVNVGDVDELAAGLPLLERMKKYLAKGPQPVKALAEDLNTTAGVVRSMISRHSSTFTRLGNKISLITEGMDF